MTKNRKRKKHPVPKASPSKQAKNDNPLCAKLRGFLNSLSETERDGFFSNEQVKPHRRAEIWMEQADLGEELVNRYSWATPDERAMQILKHFSPIIEIGCGANAYWCRQMISAGIDVVGYDQDPNKGGSIDRSFKEQQTEFHVRKGGPEVLAYCDVKERTLFLCYPDENVDKCESLGSACLSKYQGDWIIHVGELYSDATLSMDQAPWGRSSSPEFQQQLSAQYHCVLHASLPNWLHARDSISVWKRSQTCTMVFAADDEEESGDDEAEEVEYRHVPQEERLPFDIAAPCLQHLLNYPVTQNRSSSETKQLVADPKKIRSSSDMQTKAARNTDDAWKYACPW